MAKRTRSTRGKPAPAPSAAPASTPAPAPAVAPAPAPTAARAPAAPAARPRYWHDFEISWAKWTAFRLVFFGLHAADAFVQIGHAPRYGAGGFNVQQLPGHLLPEPSRAGMTFVYGALCVLFALIAQGAAVRWALPIATALYGYAYFVSQLDSYQHHYLMFLVLLLLCFVPRRPDAQSPPRLEAWSLRLILAQLAIVYTWAAIAKLDPLWLDGTALTKQIHPGWVRSAVATLSFGTVAVAVCATELTLAMVLWVRRLWFVALPLGVGLHLGIELIDLDIGLFSYFMFAIYLLLVPDVVYTTLVPAMTRAVRESLAWIPAPVRLVAGGLAIAVALVIVFRHPLPLIPVGVLALVAGALVIGFGAGPRIARVRTVALAIAPLAIFLSTTQIANDHFRTWAGSSRRMALPDERTAYLGLLAVDDTSEYAHYYLGQLEARAGNNAAALDHFHAAERSEPRRARAYLAEVQVHLAAGDRAAADDTLARGLAADPKNPELRQRKDALAGGE